MMKGVKEISFRDRLLPILQRHGVKHAAVFGSFARGEDEKESDIDVVVEFEGERSLLDLISLKQELERELGREVDLLTYNALHPRVRKTVLEEQVPIL